MCARPRRIIYRNDKIRITPTELREGQSVAGVTSGYSYDILSRENTRSIDIPPLTHDDVEYSGDFPILTVAYNLAMRDVKLNRTADGLLKAGAAWDSVWTRDIAYAAVLGTHLADPEATRRSLQSRVRDGIILQDTGTGGGWPISTDRVVWALGAWISYMTTGGDDWLAYCIDVLRKTLRQDAAVLRCTPLVPGETSFLDWREQSYPAGMTPAEIGDSFAFSTNVLHYICRRVLADMLRKAGCAEEAEGYDKQAAELANAIRGAFHVSKTAGYGMYCTRDGVLDPRADALGTALAVLSGMLGEGAQSTLENLPRSSYGTPVFAPYKRELKEAYHNRAIWPFVEAFVMLAHASEMDANGVEFSMVNLLRAALMNGSNKENYHAQTGQADATLQNSDSQLWSAAGMLGFFYHCILGLRYENGNVVFKPCIPHCVGGKHHFAHLRIRDMVLNVTVEGCGSQVASVRIGGEEHSACIPLDAKGEIEVCIRMVPPGKGSDQVHFPKVRARETLATPVWEISNPKVLQWKPVIGATFYRVYSNGAPQRLSRKCASYPVLTPRTYSRSFRVQAIGPVGVSGPSTLYEYVARDGRRILQPQRVGENAEYHVENNQAWLDLRPCTRCLVYEPAEFPGGSYYVRISYCNACASLRDGDTCALRELRVDDVPVGIIALPHNTEHDCWENYSLTAPLPVKLNKGLHVFSLCYTPDCRNGNGEVNQCMVRHIELTRIR